MTGPIARARRFVATWVLLGRPMLVRLRPGDVIVVAVNEPLDDEAMAELRRRVEDMFGYRHDILILDAGTTLTAWGAAR